MHGYFEALRDDGFVARSPGPQPVPLSPTILFAIGEAHREAYSGGAFARQFVHTTAAALQLIRAQALPVVVVDLDEPSLDGQEICRAAKATRYGNVLVTTETVAKVPAALKAGCDGVLLKPFQPNLLAARLGRTLRDIPNSVRLRARGVDWQTGTNRVWADTCCPQCGARGATSFDFSSYRRMWYACLSCEQTWLGPRQE